MGHLMSRGRRVPEWQRQAVVRALVMGEMTWHEVACAVGVSWNFVRSVARGLDKGPNRARGQVAA